MFLYELALQLGVRSTELVDRARSMGLDVGPSSYLDPTQVERLRSPGPVVGPGPAVGPSTGDPWAATAASPPAAPTAPPPAGPATAAAWSPPTVPAMIPPPPPPPPGAGFGPTAPTPPTAWGAPSVPPPPWPGPSTPSSSGSSRASGVAIAAIVVVAVAVCAYLFVGTTSDDEPTDASPVAGAGADPGAGRPAPIGEEIPDRGTVPELSGDDGRRLEQMVGEVTDTSDFCLGARKILALETSLMQAGMEVDLDGMAEAVSEHRSEWEDGADAMLDASTGNLHQDLTLYAGVYHEMLDLLADPRSIDLAESRRIDELTSGLGIVGGRINATILDVCN